MDMTLVKDVILGAAACLAAGLSWWNWLQSPSKANADAITAIEKKVGGHDVRIQTIEGELKHMPSKDTAHELKLGLVELQGVVRTQNAQLEALGRLVANMDTYLRKGDPK